jgi:hypothetical protein
MDGSQTDLSSETVTEKHLKKRGTDVSDIEIEKTVSNPEGNLAEKTLKVMLLGRLDNPRIRCHRSLHHSESDMDVLSILLKKKPQNQSFKFPFKNHSLTQDAEVEFYFVRLPNKFKR